METYKVYVNPSELRNLKADAWSEEAIKGTLITNKIKYQIHLTLRGHQIRNHKKKSYHIQFLKPWYKDHVHEIHLNAEYKDPSLIRNKLSMDFFHNIGVLAPKTEHVLLYINGHPQGIYLQLESVDQDFLKNRNLPQGPIYYATNNDANFSLLTAEGDVKPSLDEGYTKILGTEQDDEYLLELLIKINTLNDEQFNKEIGGILNIDHYLRWLAGAVCTQNFDGFVHNYALYRNSGTALFEISPWDYDGTWGRDIHGEPLDFDYVPIQGFNTLTARLLNCYEYRKNYQQILEHILKTEFTVEQLSPLVEKLLKQLQPHIKNDPYIKKNLEIFSTELNFILNFIENRNNFLTEQLLLLNGN